MLILASDIGSTTTKVVVFELKDGSFTAVGAVQEPTTVEPPFSDVTVGLFRAVRRLADSTGLDLIDGDFLLVPYFTTSSAGGGLQMMVVGYTLADSLRMAESTAYGAGAVISGAFAMDSKGSRLEHIEKMSRLNPDLVLMAGGTDGGAISGVVSMAHLLSLARPQPKYGSGAMPLLFCGNVEAREYVRETLGNHFAMQVTENIAPANRVTNPRPAIAAVQGLFMEHVMKKAPGYPSVLELVSAPVMPTPVGVAEILSAMGTGAILVDMGGATTDIFTVTDEVQERTVAANIGMSYSMTNTLSEAGLPAVMRHLGDISTETVRSWAMGKSLFPATVPDCPTSSLIEAAIAVEGLRVAWSHHKEVAYYPGNLTWKEKLGINRPSAINPPLGTLCGKRFHLNELEMVTGAGGIFSHSTPVRAAWMLAEAFRPPGLTTLYVDTHFRSPHMGTLSQKYPNEALQCYKDDCIKAVCRVLAPARKAVGPFARVTGSDGEKTVWPGSWLYIEDTTDITVHLFGPSMDGLESVGDGLPLLIDCRKPGEPLPVDFQREFALPQGSVELPFRNIEQPKPGLVQYSMSLPCPGNISAVPGDEVVPGDCLGRVEEVPPRHFIINIRGSLLCSPLLSDKEVRECITVEPGDSVKTGESIFRHEQKSHISEFGSPVNGIVTKILPPGIVFMEEDMGHDDLPHVVQVANEMSVPPSEMAKFLRVEIGDFVYRGHLIGNDNPVCMSVSPAPGFITEIDHTLGTVTVQYNMTPILIESPLTGKVIATDNTKTVAMECTGSKIQAVLGFGKTVPGPLRLLTESSAGDIAFTGSMVDSSVLKKAQERGVAGLVCNSITGDALVDWLGREPGIFITGQEEVPFSLLILCGIGSNNANATISPEQCTGIHTAIFPETKIRAGIQRPFMVISPY